MALHSNLESRAMTSQLARIIKSTQERKAKPVEPAPTPVAVKMDDSIGNIIDNIHALREEKRALEKKIKEIEAVYHAAEEQLMARFDAEGVTASRGKAASCSVSVSVSGNVTDWDAFNAFVKKKGYFHLYFKRLSDPALRELWEQGKSIPGVVPFNKRRLNVLSL